MKKRILAMLLGLTLLLGCLPAGALAGAVIIGGGGTSLSYSIGGPDDADDLDISKVGQVIEKLNNPPQGMATINDRLYAGCWDGLYVQVENGWKMLLGTEKLNNLSSIFAHDGALYLVAQTNTWADEEPTSSLTLYRLTETEEAADVETVLENIPLGLDDDWPNFSSMFMDNDSLYMLYMNYGGRTGNDYGNNILLKVSLVDGSVSRVFQDYVQAVSPDGKGKLAGIYWKQEDAYREEDVIKPNLVSIDPVSGEITHHGSLLSPNVGALTLDAAAGCLYLVDDNKLYRYDDVTSAGVLCAYLPPNGSYSNNTGSAVMNGFFYIGTYSNNDDHFVSCSVDPSLLPNRKLRLASGAVEYELINAFCKAHPEIAIESVDAWFNSAEEMSQFMVSGDDSADVLYLSASSPIFPALRGKGYLADLSGSDVLAQFMSSVYPHMIQSLYQNDKLIAYPNNISSSTFGYYPAALEKVGLTEEDLPKSLMGLMDFAEMWHNDYAEEYPDIHLFSDAYSLYEQLFSMILEYQVVACDAKGEQVTFNTPTVRALLTRLEQLKPILDDMSMKPDADGSYTYSGPFNDDGEPGAMFSTYTNLMPERYGHSAWDGTPLLLSLVDDDEPYVPLNMSLLIVNPNSPNKDLAITYLEFLAQNRHQAEKVALMPEENTTLESEYYQESKKSIEDMIARVQRALESAPEESKENYKDQLEWLNLELENIEEQRFAISEEDIADYRAIAPHLTVMTTNVFSESEDIQSITKRYLDGQMSAEQFIREFDRIVTMMLMENY